MGKRGRYFGHFIKNLPIAFSYSVLHKNPKISSFLGQKDMSIERANDILKQKILEGKPFAMIRFGGMEMCALNGHEKIELGFSKRYKDSVKYVMKHNTGFFPSDDEHLKVYGDRLLSQLGEVDVLGILGLFMESYFAKTYCPSAEYVLYEGVEPCHGDWTSALAGKKVLVISPFEDEIKAQYAKRQLLFPEGSNILPEFGLRVIKSPMTLGEEEGELPTFFDELDRLYQKMDSEDFDVLLVGAGAYGSFLALHAKELGKISIQTGGATQTLFGIMGKRWEKREHVAQYCNEHWIRPYSKPKGNEVVDGGAYW